MMRFAKQAEETFLQRTILKRQYGMDISRLTLWEYFLLLEHITKNKES